MAEGKQTLHDLNRTTAVSEPLETLKCLEYKFQMDGICVSYLGHARIYTATAGTILQRCISEVNRFRHRMGKKLCVYKIGLTSNPCVRFQFYKEANYTHMTLLHVSDQLGVVQMLEAALITMNKPEHACRNERPGGEGPPGSKNEHHNFFFVYVVGARADQMKAIR